MVESNNLMGSKFDNRHRVVSKIIDAGLAGHFRWGPVKHCYSCCSTDIIYMCLPTETHNSEQQGENVRLAGMLQLMRCQDMRGVHEQMTWNIPRLSAKL